MINTTTQEADTASISVNSPSRSIFERRVAYKPYEYPDVMKFVDAINHSYWLVSEFNFISDTQDFLVNLTEQEQDVIRKALLAISQIEVKVKNFWGNLGDRFPKAEFEEVGSTFAESEVRHSRAYSHLLEILGLNDNFSSLLDVPAIQNRVEYLTKYLKGASDNNHENFTLTLALFSMFIENVSLFSQFVIIRSFYKHKNMLKGVDNVIQATQKEEAIHALLGAYIIKEIQEERPEWFNEEFYAKLYRACKKAYAAEIKIIDWIYENGELSFLPKDHVYEFIKQRFNESMLMVGGKAVFEVNENILAEMQWFNDEIYGGVSTDFFNKKSVNYSKRTQAITDEDLF